MLSQLLNQMDEYLSNKPFKRRWWSRPCKVHMTIQPPLSKDCPLWKRSQDELRLLRLFDLSPEELGQKIERYWEKPRWRRWFASFGMNKKIDVWNYYQRCLAYQRVRPDKREQESVVIASKRKSLLNELGLCLHQFNVKFETYLEKRCRNTKWREQHFLEEIKAYKQQLKKIFLTKLNKSLKKIKTEGERFALKQQAEQEYQQVEALMLRYYRQRWNDFFSRPSQANLVPEVGTDVAQEENRANPERNLAVYHDSQTVSFSSQSTLPREDHQTGINSLHGAKEWIQTQRQHVFLKYLDNLQRRLKPLLQGGMLLFHPDHMMNLTPSQAIWELLTRYSQSYLEQSRCYLDRFNNYHRCLEAFYQLSQKELEKKQELQGLPGLERRIQELAQSFKELKQSFKDFAKELKEVEAKRAKDKEAMAAQLERDKEVMEAKLKESEARLERDKEVMEAKLKESEARLERDKEVMEAKLKEFEAKLDKLFTHSTQHQQASTFSASDVDVSESNVSLKNRLTL